MTKDELEKLFNQYHRDVFNIAFFFTTNKEDSEDIVIDVFYDLMQKPPKHTKGIKSYLLTSASHKALNLLNHKNHLKTIEFSDEFLGKEETIYDDHLAKYIKELPYKIRLVIVYYYFIDLTINEISKALHVRESAVKKRLERGRKILKERLKNERS